MADPTPEEDDLKRRVNELDDRLDALVRSIDADAPDGHAAIYAEIERLQGEMAALKRRERLDEDR